MNAVQFVAMQPRRVRFAIYVAEVVSAFNDFACTVLRLRPAFPLTPPAVIPGAEWSRTYLASMYSRYRQVSR